MLYLQFHNLLKLWAFVFMPHPYHHMLYSKFCENKNFILLSIAVQNLEHCHVWQLVESIMFTIYVDKNEEIIRRLFEYRGLSMNTCPSAMSKEELYVSVFRRRTFLKQDWQVLFINYCMCLKWDIQSKSSHLKYFLRLKKYHWKLKSWKFCSVLFCFIFSH